MAHIDKRFLHVPGTRWATFGAQPAMEAHVLVLDHDTPGLERVRDVERLVAIQRRGAETPPQILLESVVREGDTIRRADVRARVALDAETSREDGLHVAVEAALRLRVGES